MFNELKQQINIKHKPKQKNIHYNKLGVNLTDLRNSERKLAKNPTIIDRLQNYIIKEPKIKIIKQKKCQLNSI